MRGHRLQTTFMEETQLTNLSIIQMISIAQRHKLQGSTVIRDNSQQLRTALAFTLSLEKLAQVLTIIHQMTFNNILTRIRHH